MAFDRTKYPPYWKIFSRYIREERAQNKCEKCGIENGAINARGSTVVLTTAHLDFDGGICQCRRIYGRKCARPDHVMAMCQRCHLALDRPYHIKKRRRNALLRKDEQRGLLNLT